MLHDIPAKLQGELGCGSDELVTFTQTTFTVNSYRDAVRFSGGREVSLQELKEGQRVDVVDLDLAREREPNLAEFIELSGRRS